MLFNSRLLAAAAFVLTSLSPLHAATVTDDAADVMLIGGDIIAEAYSPVSDTSGFDPVYAMVSGGVVGFTPAFVLSLEDADGEVVYGEASTFSFDDTGILSFVFDITGSAASYFGSQVNVAFMFDTPISNPFGDDADYYETSSMTIAPLGVSAVPLPAGLPMMISGVVMVAALRRRALKSSPSCAV